MTVYTYVHVCVYKQVQHVYMCSAHVYECLSVSIRTLFSLSYFKWAWTLQICHKFTQVIISTLQCQGTYVYSMRYINFTVLLLLTPSKIHAYVLICILQFCTSISSSDSSSLSLVDAPLHDSSYAL